MKIKEVVSILDGKVCCCENLLDNEVFSACASDMMSDVLAFVKDQSLLLSGLCNPQVIRTADMLDIRCVALVRGKTPSPDMVALAEQKGIVILSSNLRMFLACGLLYQAGLQPGEVIL